MANPFFKAVKYPLDRTEGENFRRLLIKAITRPADIEDVYQRCSGELDPLNLGQPPRLIWRDALDNLSLAGLLEKLCKIIEVGAYNPQLKNAVKAIRQVESASEARIISDDVVVLDRIGLREQLEQIENEMSPLKVVIVRGDPKSGKSHGRYLFEKLAYENDAKPVYIYDGLVVSVDELITYLFSEIKLNGEQEIPPKDSTSEAWYRSVCIKLAQITADKGKAMWIAVDDLGNDADGAPLLDSEIRKFFDQFALNMLNPSFRKWFRLMLINYPDGPVPTKWKNEFWKENRTSSSDVKLEDISDLLKRWSSGRNHNILAADLLSLAEKVLHKGEADAATPNANKPRLQCINEALMDAVNELERSVIV